MKVLNLTCEKSYNWSFFSEILFSRCLLSGGFRWNIFFMFCRCRFIFTVVIAATSVGCRYWFRFYKLSNIKFCHQWNTWNIPILFNIDSQIQQNISSCFWDLIYYWIKIILIFIFSHYFFNWWPQWGRNNLNEHFSLSLFHTRNIYLEGNFNISYYCGYWIK